MYPVDVLGATRYAPVFDWCTPERVTSFPAPVMTGATRPAPPDPVYAPRTSQMGVPAAMVVGCPAGRPVPPNTTRLIPAVAAGVALALMADVKSVVHNRVRTVALPTLNSPVYRAASMYALSGADE